MLLGVVGRRDALAKDSGSALESAAEEGDSPVDEILRQLAGTRVPQDTRNPVGSREDHLPSLNTVW